MSLGNPLGLKGSYTGKWLNLTHVFYKDVLYWKTI